MLTILPVPLVSSKRPNLLIVSFTIAVFQLRALPARADEPPAAAAPLSVPDSPAKPERPWADNVAEDAQKQAMQLFEEGNKLFEDSQHAAALAKYREALKVWDHPAIRYNAAVALINLDQPLVAYENLELALKYGEAPLAPETYLQALTYRKLRSDASSPS